MADQLQNLNLLYIPYNAKFFIVKEINISFFEIADIYQIASNSPKIYSEYASWEKNKLTLFKEEIFSNRINLQGHKVKLAGYFLVVKSVLMRFIPD